MYKKIAGKDIDPEKLEELKIDEKSTNSFSLENANKKISDLENKNKVLENEKKEFENKNKQKDLKFLN